MLNGIDFAVGNGVTTDQILGGGNSFVCRYLSNHLQLGGVDKDISAFELANYKAAGIAVVFVWETDGTMPDFATGQSDALAANLELATLGASIGDVTVSRAPIFFAADAQTVADLNGYLAGVNSVIGTSRTGIYGGLANVTAAFDAGLVAYGWQTYAWSGGQWDDRALIRQVKNGVDFYGASIDQDQAAFWNVATPILGLSDDFGQWYQTAAPAPAPTPAPVPVPKAITSLTVQFSDGTEVTLP